MPKCFRNLFFQSLVQKLIPATILEQLSEKVQWNKYPVWILLNLQIIHETF